MRITQNLKLKETKMDKLIVFVGGVVLVVAGAVALGMLMSLPVYWLWNGCLVGAVDGVKEITWLQAWGLFVLCNFLFKSTVSKK
jgi:hypothetical protein